MMAGKISFGASSSYAKAHLKAQKDDEMSRSFRQPNQVITIEDIDYPASKIILRNNIAKADGTPINYHLLCTSYEESAKLGREFCADGFVRIRDCNKFLSLIKKEVRQRFPKAFVDGSYIRYYDDREGHNATTLTEMIFCKAIEFLYQREYRIALIDIPCGERIEIKITPPSGLFELHLYERGLG
jgi:hypothetical protein